MTKVASVEKRSSRIVPFIVAAALTAVIGGCSAKDLDQDPYADQPETIRNGIPPGQSKPVVDPKPEPAEALRIDAADFYSFKESEETEVVFGGRILRPVHDREAVLGVDFDIAIENLSQFPGATYDPVRGVFRWRPPEQWVADEYTRHAKFDVVMTTKAPPYLSTRRSIQVFVTRDDVDPQVLDVGDIEKKSMREGDRKTFYVTVSDPDSANEANKRPRIFAISDRIANGGAHLVFPVESTEYNPNPKPHPTDPKKWIFEMVIDTRSRELTNSQVDVSFALVAVSRFGRSSVPKNVTVKVATSVEMPQISLLDRVEVVAGQETVITFMAFDPKGEGQVTAKIIGCESLRAHAACKCIDQGYAGSQICSIRWKVASDIVSGPYTVNVEATNRSKIYRDTESKSYTYVREIRVMPAPVPPPTPTPTPNPSPTPAPTPTPTPTSEPDPAVTPKLPSLYPPDSNTRRGAK